MTVYPLSWAYYLSFIFFTAFAFLNMVIGIVVNTLHEESDRVRLRQQGLDEVSMNQLYDEIKEMKLLLASVTADSGSAEQRRQHADKNR